jgi:hypothetical protein
LVTYTQKQKLMESPKNLLPLLFATIFFSGCAIGDFTPYSGQQQSWPTQPGSFVSTKYVIPAYIHSWPDRPYLVLGYLDATTAPIRRRGAVAFASRRAKELGADAIVVMQQGQEYAGSISTGSMLTGRVPFRGAPGEVMHQHQHAPLPLEQLKDVPQPLVVLLEMLLQKDHAKRPQSPAELLKGDGDDKRCHRGRAQNRSSEPAEDAPSRFWLP